MRGKKKRQVFENVEVIDAGAKGKTVGKAPDGRVIFLSNTVPGDVVDVQTTKKRKAYFEGIATKFHALSEKRVEPTCEHFGICGGCKWQHMGYEHQLFYKQKEVENNLKRIGHLELPKLNPILGSKEQYFYRNKMEYSFSDSRWLTLDEIQSDIEIKKCHLQKDPSNAIRLEVRDFAIQNGISFFNPRNQHGMLRTLMIRTASTGEIMVVIQFYEDNEVKRGSLLSHIKETFPEITSLQYVINKKQNDTIYDQNIICYSGRNHIIEKMEGLQFKINAKSFYQTNSEQAYELYKVARDFAGLTGSELVYDLYTGTGTIAQFVSKKAKKVVGIESVPEAIADAKENAKNNAIDNVDFFVGDMKNIFNEDFINTHGRPEVIITDPPRDGMHTKVIQQILNIAPKKIVYVSCNSATQARDLALMKDQYSVIKVQAVDMFPQTHHVENVVLLEKI